MRISIWRGRKALQIFGTILIVVFLAHMLVFSFIGLHDDLHPADVIVVFGNTVNPDGTLSLRLESRLRKSLEMHKLGFGKFVIVSGGLGKEGYDEATSMQKYLISQGVPPEAIITDSTGLNTLATAINTKKTMRDRGFHSVFLVSQYFHIARSAYIFKNTGVDEVYHAHAEIFEWRDLYSLPREIVAFYSYMFTP